MDKFKKYAEILKNFSKDMEMWKACEEDEIADAKSVFQMQLDIISFVLRIADPIMLKEIYADTKVSYEKQIQEA